MCGGAGALTLAVLGNRSRAGDAQLGAGPARVTQPRAASPQQSRAVHKGKHVSILNSDPRPLAAFWSADVLEMSPQSSALKRLESFQLANDRGQPQMLL